MWPQARVWHRRLSLVGLGRVPPHPACCSLSSYHHRAARPPSLPPHPAMSCVTPSPVRAHKSLIPAAVAERQRSPPQTLRCRSKTPLNMPNAPSRSKNTNRPWSTTRLRSNWCELHVPARPAPCSDLPARDSTKAQGEDAPETADLYFSYGKALLENAITQSSVLGKQDPDDSFEDEQGAYHPLAPCSATPALTTRNLR